ncbi:MAG TPA: hypothetical protein VFO99_02290 [Pyrinomonadaceae bacterium]|nr:hypothetical protein [Pyrinomonadaceae bacterium]
MGLAVGMVQGEELALNSSSELSRPHARDYLLCVCVTCLKSNNYGGANKNWVAAVTSTAL